MTLKLTPSGQSCGATVVGVDLAAELDAATVAEIRSAWLQHKVLAFPNQELDDNDLARFTRYFGPFGVDPYFAPIEGHPNVAAIERRADETSSLFADNWHADWSFQEHPPDGTCLYGIAIPPTGGDTLFANQTAALAAMSPQLRAALDGRLAVHSARGGYAPDGTYGNDDADDRSMQIRPNESAYATQLHPFIRVHPETGEETLYSILGYIIGVDGMTDEAARPILGELYGLQTRDEFVYRHRWEQNMLVMWDNRCILHKATAGYDGHHRLLHRCTIGYNPHVRQS